MNWIKVTDELPKSNGQYIVWDSNLRNCDVIRYWIDDECFPQEYTHWMPVPESPKD